MDKGIARENDECDTGSPVTSTDLADLLHLKGLCYQRVYE